MIIVGLPYLVTEVLSFDSVWANQLCGFAQGALAVGGLAGGVCAGIFGKRLNIQKAGNLLAVCALTVFPIGISLMLFSLAELNYVVITVCCMIIMAFSTIFTIQMMSFVQTETPQNLIGKVYSVILTVCMCAQPVGSALYGFLFEFSSGFEYLVVLFAGVASLIVALCTKGLFKMLSQNN